MSKSITRKGLFERGPSASSGTIGVSSGGTGITSYAVGDLIYASGATTLSKLADVATGSVLVSGGVGIAPSWSTSLTLTSSISAGAATSIGFTGRSIIKSPADGFFAFSNAAATAFANIVVGTVTTGNASSTVGKIIFQNASNSNTMTIQSGVSTGNFTLTLPVDDGTSGQYLQTDGAGVLSWATPSSGITIGGTAITSGADNRILFQDATASDYITQTANFTMGAVASGYLDVPSGYAAQGVAILYTSTGASGYRSTHVGYRSGDTSPTGDSRTALGFGANRSGTGSDVISIGAAANYGGQNYNYSLFIGSSGLSSVGMNNTAANQAVIGMPNGNGYTQFYFGQGVSAVTGTPSGVTFNATPGTTAGGAFSIFAGAGSGSDKAGGVLTLGGGAGTGAGAIGTTVFKAPVAGASSSTLQTYATVLTITNSTTITTSDAVNYALGSTTGTKFGTATTQKLAFWGVTPVTQYATTGTTTGFTANASANTLFNESTFTGDTGATAYTISDLVKALKLCGIILA